MSINKKIKKYLPLIPQRTLYSRREELVEMINKDGAYLPKSILHSDLDRGFLDFVKEDLKLVTAGKVVPTIDIIITTQNWTQFTETWNFQDLDKNVAPPFITVVRAPEVKFGTNPAVLYNIPNRKQYFYAIVPNWDGQRKGADVYKIPQPVPVDITYSVKIICNRMRELNKFNQIILEKFASRQAYRNIKGHYIPIVMNNISDESTMDVEKRKYYVQNYEFTMLGFLIDEEEFQVSPAISRAISLLEIDSSSPKKRRKHQPENQNKFIIDAPFSKTSNEYVRTFEYTGNLFFSKSNNIRDYDVYINENYYGTNINEIQVTTNDVVKIDVEKIIENENSSIQFTVVLL